jgi:hypothetical protein
MKLRSIFTTLSAAALLAATLTSAFAQYYNGEHGYRDPGRDASYDRGDAARRWDRFLDDGQNRDFARRFHANPNIVHDPNEMEQDSGVRELFDNHPEVRDYVFDKVRDYNRDAQPAEKWDRLMAANPNFADRYRENPGIINDSNLASDEPAIAQFLRTNPDVRDYLHSYSSRDDRDRDEDLSASAGLDSFMANHPKIARQLHDNPSLINDRDWVRSHPNLHEYLQNHPDARY